IRSSSTGPSAGDHQSPPQARARDSVTSCPVLPSRVSSTAKSSETGSPKGSPSDYPFADRASLPSRADRSRDDFPPKPASAAGDRTQTPGLSRSACRRSLSSQRRAVNVRSPPADDWPSLQKAGLRTETPKNDQGGVPTDRRIGDLAPPLEERIQRIVEGVDLKGEGSMASICRTLGLLNRGKGWKQR